VTATPAWRHGGGTDRRHPAGRHAGAGPIASRGLQAFDRHRRRRIARPSPGHAAGPAVRATIRQLSDVDPMIIGPATIPEFDFAPVENGIIAYGLLLARPVAMPTYTPVFTRVEFTALLRGAVASAVVL